MQKSSSFFINIFSTPPTVTIKQTGSCGDVKTGLMTANFVSPKYPAARNGDLLCTFGFVFMENAVAAKLAREKELDYRFGICFAKALTHLLYIFL